MPLRGELILAGCLTLVAGQARGTDDAESCLQTYRAQAYTGPAAAYSVADDELLPSGCRGPLDAYPEVHDREAVMAWARSPGPDETVDLHERNVESRGNTPVPPGAGKHNNARKQRGKPPHGARAAGRAAGRQRRGRKERGKAAEPDSAQQLPAGTRACSSHRDYLSNLRPLLIPSMKLALCYVSKVACTQMKDLFNMINGFTDPKYQGFGATGYLLSTTSYNFKGVIDEKSISRENGWKFAMFVRDPALRYISAYGSCCMRNPEGEYEHAFACCGRLENASDPEVVAAEFRNRVKQDVLYGLPYNDMHWGSHADHIRQCGYENFRPENLDFVGTLAGDVNGQVKDMLRMTNATPEMPGNFTQDQLVDYLFPPGRIAGHQSSAKSKASAFLRDKATLEGLKSLYAEDYRMFPQIGCEYSNQGA